MAKRKLLEAWKSNESVETVFYMNETSVGERGQNIKKSDIELVQYFLRIFYKGHPNIFKLLPKTRTKSSMILVDGVVGGQTIEGIRQFQGYHKKYGEPSRIVDGLVSVSRDYSALDLYNASTITKLNIACRYSSQQYNIDMDNLENEPEIAYLAPNLRAELMASKLQVA